MKRTIALSLTAALLAVLLAGCGSTPAPDSEPEPSAASEPAPTEAPAPSETPPASTPMPTPEPTPDPDLYTPGVRTDTGYLNTTLGLQFTPADTMVMASDEEIDTLIGYSLGTAYADPETGDRVQDAVQATTDYEMLAIDMGTGATIIVATEKLPLAAMTEEQYAAAVEQQLAQTTLGVELEDLTTTELCGTTYTVLQTTTDNGTASVMQSILLKKCGDRMAFIALSYPDAATLDTLLGCFTPTSASTV